MANDEHVAMLKKGVDAWNGWRRKNRNIRPNLSEADLINAKRRTSSTRTSKRRTSAGRTSARRTSAERTLAVLAENPDRHATAA
jgi:hypothetical protein